MALLDAWPGTTRKAPTYRSMLAEGYLRFGQAREPRRPRRRRPRLEAEPATFSRRSPRWTAVKIVLHGCCHAALAAGRSGRRGISAALRRRGRHGNGLAQRASAWPTAPPAISGPRRPLDPLAPSRRLPLLIMDLAFPPIRTARATTSAAAATPPPDPFPRGRGVGRPGSGGLGQCAFPRRNAPPNETKPSAGSGSTDDFLGGQPGSARSSASGVGPRVDSVLELAETAAGEESEREKIDATHLTIHERRMDSRPLFLTESALPMPRPSPHPIPGVAPAR